MRLRASAYVLWALLALCPSARAGLACSEFYLAFVPGKVMSDSITYPACAEDQTSTANYRIMWYVLEQVGPYPSGLCDDGSSVRYRWDLKVKKHPGYDWTIENYPPSSTVEGPYYYCAKRPCDTSAANCRSSGCSWPWTSYIDTSGGCPGKCRVNYNEYEPEGLLAAQCLGYCNSLAGIDRTTSFPLDARSNFNTLRGTPVCACRMADGTARAKAPGRCQYETDCYANPASCASSGGAGGSGGGGGDLTGPGAGTPPPKSSGPPKTGEGPTTTTTTTTGSGGETVKTTTTTYPDGSKKTETTTTPSGGGGSTTTTTLIGPTNGSGGGSGPAVGPGGGSDSLGMAGGSGSGSGSGPNYTGQLADIIRKLGDIDGNGQMEISELKRIYTALASDSGGDSVGVYNDSALKSRLDLIYHQGGKIKLELDTSKNLLRVIDSNTRFDAVGAGSYADSLDASAMDESGVSDGDVAGVLGYVDQLGDALTLDGSGCNEFPLTYSVATPFGAVVLDFQPFAFMFGILRIAFLMACYYVALKIVLRTLQGAR